ncbi:hypothetical protein XENOCAPTIV_021373 [Xenoophorus captivus]|uniref:Secreted protein n=1 Tax=Xenoophorus captivus TaxID=1517983 RepID=A0ABV0QSX8_9TELE
MLYVCLSVFLTPISSPTLTFVSDWHLHVSPCKNTLFTQACGTSVETPQQLFPREYPIRSDGVKNKGGGTLSTLFSFSVSLFSHNRILFMRAHSGLLRFVNGMVRNEQSRHACL